MKTIHAILFDLDGTLLDSMQMWEDVDRRFLSRYGITPPEGLAEEIKPLSINEASEYFVRRFLLPCTPDEVTNQIEEIAAEEYRAHLPLKDGVTELLDRADALEIPYAIVTATYQSLAESALRRLGIYDRFRFILTCTEVDAAKTSPKIYLEAARRLGAEVQSCLVAEDSLYCINTANRAGFFTAAVFDKAADWESCKAAADYAFLSLNDFAAWLGREEESV